MAVLSVSAWSPADAAVVAPGSGVVVDFATAGSTEQEHLYDEAAEFDLGVYSSTQSTTADELELEPVDSAIDFAAYNVAALTSVGQPETWLARSTADRWSVVDLSGNRCVRVTTDDGDVLVTVATLEDAGDVDQGVIRFRTQWASVTSDPWVGVCWDVHDTGASVNGYALVLKAGATYATMGRFYGGSFAVLQTFSLGTTLALSTWYNVHLRFVNTGSEMQCWGKFWAEGDSEPSTETYIGADSSYDTAGRVGLCTKKGTYDYCSVYLDDYAFAEETTYPASGTWTSDNLDTSTVGRYSTGLVSWTEDLPTGSSAVVELRWNGGAWQACTNGSPPPGITYDQDMSALSGFEDCDLRVTLATTDDTVTPSLTDLRLYFLPFDAALLSLEIAGEACTEGDGRLEVWGDRQVSGGTPLVAWDALHAAATPWWYGSPGESVTAELTYDSTTIDSITLEVERLTWGDHLPADCTFVVPTVARETALTRLEWTPTGNAIGTNRACEWHVLDKGMAIHADCKYYVAHVQIDDVPGEVIAAVPNPQDFPGELIVYGWQRDDHPGELLVQGWRVDDIPGQVIPAVRTAGDFPGGLIVATRRSDDFPGSVVVYGVNRANVLEVRVVDEATWAALVAAGYGVS